MSVGIAAAIAIAGARSRGGSHDGGAHIGVGLHGSAYLIDFIQCEFPRSETGQYSVVFLSRHSYSPFCFLLHSLARGSD
jgi:hypothetical protein